MPGPALGWSDGKSSDWGPDMNRLTFGTATAILALSLASCTASDVTPPPADGGTFETIDELKEAVESAGLVCPELVFLAAGRV